MISSSRRRACVNALGEGSGNRTKVLPRASHDARRLEDQLPEGAASEPPAPGRGHGGASQPCCGAGALVAATAVGVGGARRTGTATSEGSGTPPFCGILYGLFRRRTSFVIPLAFLIASGVVL